MAPRVRWTSVALLAAGLVVAIVLGARGIGPLAGSFDRDGSARTPASGEATLEARDGDSAPGSPGLRSIADARREGSGSAVAAEPWELAVHVTRSTFDEDAVAVPLPARVRLIQRVGDSVEVLGEAAAGADGMAILDLTPLRRIPPLAIESSVSVQVRGERSKPEEVLAREWGDVRPPPAGPARLRLEVPLDEARVVRGRVVDGSGRPVPGALLFVELEGTWSDSGFTDVGGVYELGGPADPGVGFRLVARHPVFGVAYSQPISGDSSEGVQVPDLVLAADATIEGEVSWPDGSAAFDVEVQGVPRDTVGGVYDARSRTDRHGRFRLVATAGLVYDVGPVVEGDTRSRQASTAGGPPLRFVLDAYRLRVRVRDVDGRPLPGISVTVRRIPSDRAVALARGDVGEMRDEPFLTAGAWLPEINASYEAKGPQAEADILVPAGISLLVTAEADAYLLTEAAVEGLGAAGERTVELVLPPRSALGTIRVELGASEGVQASRVGYVVQTLSGRDLSLGYLDAEGRIPSAIPAGAWALTLVPVSAQSAPGERSPLTYPKPWTADLEMTRFPWRGLVRVQDHREAIVTPTFRRGGRVRIRVEDGPGELAGTEVSARRKGAEFDLPLERFGRQATPGEGAFWVGDGLARPQVTSEDLFEPGEYVLRFRPAGEGTPQDLPLVIRAGEITEVVYTPR